MADRGRDQVAVQVAGDGAAGVEVELAEDMYGSPVAFRTARRADEMSGRRGVRGDRLVFGRHAEVQVVVVQSLGERLVACFDEHVSDLDVTASGCGGADDQGAEIVGVRGGRRVRGAPSERRPAHIS